MRTQTLLYDGFQRCPYLPGQVARLPLYLQRARLSLGETDAAFASGERRSGRSLYRTTCPTCTACQPLRVRVPDFVPSKSQARVLRRWEGLGRVETGPPQFTDAHLDLFNRHKQQRGLAEPGEEAFGAEDYRSWLVNSCLPTEEMRYYIGDRLIGVGIVDVGATALSSVYFYFDPDREVSRLSPGVYSVLQEIDYARRTGRAHLYLGLYVKDSRHLSYKGDYRPHERLIDGDWRAVEERG